MGKEKNIFAIVLLLILIIMVLLAFGFNKFAAFMPLVIGIPAVILAAVNIFVEFKHDKEAEQKGLEKTSSKFSWWVAHGDELLIWFWVLGLVILVGMIGVLWGGGTFLFLFLLFKSKQKLHISLLITIIFMLAIYTFLFNVLSLKLYPGILL